MVDRAVLNTVALIWYAQIPVDGSYAHDLLGGYVMFGFGLAFAFIPVSIAALAGVGPREAGLASGLLNTAQQVGGAVGVAIATSVAVSHSTHLLQTGDSQAAALTSGYALAFWVIAGISAAGAVAALVLVKNEIPAEAQPSGGLSRCLGFPAMPREYPTLLDLVGATPIVRLDRLSPPGHARILAKLEYLNPGGSVKDRIGLAMIEAGRARGEAQAGRHDRRADLGQHRRRPRHRGGAARATAASSSCPTR